MIGNKILAEPDFKAGGESPLRFTRVYNTSIVAATDPTLLLGWMHNYAMSVNSNTNYALVSRPDGKAYGFNLVGSSWTPDADVSDKLIQLTSGGVVTGWQYSNASDDSLEVYDQYGNLSSITYRDGKSVTLSYVIGGSAPTFPAQILSASDSFGNTLTFNATASPRTMTDPNGEVYTYALNAFNFLSS